MENNFDTIVAIITPIAQGAVGIIRISGDKAFEIAQSIFSNPIKPKMINYGHILSDNQQIDEVILLPFKSPHSYTGEDVVEIQCHGSCVILDEILNIIISKGARIAQKGEFTKRAFLNHRIDLSQAEAVLDIIESKSQKSAHNALNNLGGYLKQKIDAIKSDITELYSKIIASIDFPEDVNEVDNNSVVTICNDNIFKIDGIIKNSKSHNFIRDGISVCLIGKPNVGKSSLFNTLLNYNRAIVTDIAGTTRDAVDTEIKFNDREYVFIDTAGLRRKNKIKEDLEHYMIVRTVSAVERADIVVLVIPIDSSAPKGRLILPQQQVIRDILEAGAVSVVVKDTELADALKRLGGKPYMVITDSQAFKRVSEVTPKDIYLTSFSILMARWKGFLDAALEGAAALDDIQEGDEILIAEGCTHHRQCEDIGTVKLPKWICKYTGVTPKFTFTSGGEFPEDVRRYKVVIHCGGCMLNERSMRYRMKLAVSQKVPFTNYGTAIAKMNGILDRSVEVIVKHKENNAG